MEIVTEDRLAKLKCPNCGCTEKSAQKITVTSNGKEIHLATVVCCKGCGYTMTFGHNAFEMYCLMVGHPTVDRTNAHGGDALYIPYSGMKLPEAAVPTIAPVSTKEPEQINRNVPKKEHHAIMHKTDIDVVR